METTGEIEEESKHAKWTNEEVAALIDYLHTNHSERADAGNFQQATYAKAAESICKLHRSSKIKDSKNVSIKWGSLKHMYNAIMTYRSGSGKHWDNENSANICGVADAEKWAKFVAMKPFHNKGWQYLPMMEDIFP
ncbi:hypothetical protein M404DRAFT_170082, partial [Pisolithus tinctorius Marx 270]